MKIHILYTDKTAAAALIYALDNSSLSNLDLVHHGRRAQFQTFQIKDPDCTYYFEPNTSLQNVCDLSILVSTCRDLRANVLLSRLDEFDLVFLTSDLTQFITPQQKQYILNYLDQSAGHYFILTHSDPELESRSDKVFLSHQLNLYWMYWEQGFFWLNYPTDCQSKTNLLGTYAHRARDYKSYRLDLIKRIEHKTEQTVKIYGHSHNHSLWEAWMFQRYMVTNYSDYQTSVANISIETAINPEAHMMFTEKTVKAIVYTRAHTFFILIHQEKAMQYLYDKGFWFLNTDYWRQGAGLEQSAVLCINRIKTMSRDLNTVYSLLRTEYQEQLNKNYQIWNDLLNYADYTDWLKNILKLSAERKKTVDQ